MSCDFLDQLEAESIYILREVAGQFRNPVMLFSGGKDSIVMTRLAEKAFRPGRFPFPLMLIDTGQNFPETLSFIERRTRELKERLLVKYVQDTINLGRVSEESGPLSSRNRLQSVTLMDAIHEHHFDAVIGGARRDEEKSRAKERIFSVRNEFGQWEPKDQRSELWNLLNGCVADGEHMRVFPLSNWTELDIWEYIRRERLEVPSIYFSHRRHCVKIEGAWMASSQLDMDSQELEVRVRTVGDMACTAAMISSASTVDEVIAEIRTLRLSERGLRMDDKRSESSMEDRKREGYF